jgi:hypothetical protein
MRRSDVEPEEDERQVDSGLAEVTEGTGNRWKRLGKCCTVISSMILYYLCSVHVAVVCA